MSTQVEPQSPQNIKAQPKQASARFCAGEVIVLLAFCLFGCIMGQVLSTLYRQGAFARWQPLGTLPSGEIQIIGASSAATEHQVDVLVKSGDGKIYRRSTGINSDWVEATPPTEDMGGIKRDSSGLCECTIAGRERTRPSGCFDMHLISVSLRSDLQDCTAKIWAWEWGADAVTYTVVLRDNSVWQWYEDFANILPVTICAAPLLGFFLGIGVLWFIRRRQRLGKTDLT